MAMKRLTVCVMIILALSSGIWAERTHAKCTSRSVSENSIYYTTMKRDLLCLMMAYPEYITSIESGDGSVYVVMKSGRRIKYDDKKAKSFEVKMANPDLQDMMEQIYPIHDINSIMDINYDPGRIRVYSLLMEVYGASRERVQSNLKNVNTGYGSLQFNSRNRAAESLKGAFKDLVPMARSNGRVQSALVPMSGTFNYRYIAGTNRLSPHSFGIAIDLARDKRDYWKWASREQGQKRLSSYPREIVNSFEKHNFIWGGKWGHFDILHFEYRPEIIYKSRFFNSRKQTTGLWYDGVPYEDPSVKEYIRKIEESL